jgi:hypothetical protein
MFELTPGVNVMITIFCDFCKFSAKNGVFLKNPCYVQIFARTGSSLSQKCQYFRQIFWRKYFLNRNIGSRCFVKKQKTEDELLGRRPNPT